MIRLVYEYASQAYLRSAFHSASDVIPAVDIHYHERHHPAFVMRTKVSSFAARVRIQKTTLRIFVLFESTVMTKIAMF